MTIESKLNQVIATQDRVVATQAAQGAVLSALSATVQGIAAVLGTDEDPAAMKELTDRLKTSAAALQAAVDANQPPPVV